MIYPFIQLKDHTEIVHSGIITSNTGEEVKVNIEKSIDNGFKSATCLLPYYTWSEIDGFSDSEIKCYQEIIESTAHLIFRFTKQGGLGNASEVHYYC